MNWLFFALIAYALYSVTNFTDKFLIEKRIKNPVSIVILGGSTYFVLGITIFLISGSHFIPVSQALLLLIAGSLLTFYLIPYFKALMLEDASRVVPLFLFYPIFTLLLSFIFLKEVITSSEFIGFIFIIIGGFILGTKKITMRVFSLRKALFLMLASSSLYATSNIIFKFITINNFWVNFSYLTFGSALGCFLLLFKKSYRKVFTDQMKILTLNSFLILIVNSILNLAAELFAFMAISVGPLALVSAMNGIQPFIVLIYGLILTIFFPKIIKEDIKKETIFIKIIASIILFIGVWLVHT